MKFAKGSAEAKAYMAALRQRRGCIKSCKTPLSGGKIPRYLRKAGTKIAKNLVTAGVGAVTGLPVGMMGGKMPRYLRKAGTAIAKNLVSAGVRASDRLTGGKMPRYLRKAGTAIAKNLVSAGVRASDKLTGGCMGGTIARMYDPISGDFLRTEMKGSGFRAIGSGFVPA